MAKHGLTIPLTKKPESELVWDAHRFLQMFGKVIEDAPLQVYVSALLFSPSKSIIRQSFQAESPHWVRILPNDLIDWTSCVQKFDDPHKDKFLGSYHYLSISCCDTWIASEGLNDIQIWDVKTGRPMRNIKAYAYHYVFSPWNDDELAAMDIDDQRLTIWDVSSGKPTQQLELPPQTRIRDMSFFRSEPGMLGARLEDDDLNSFVAVWNTATGERISTVLMKGDSDHFTFSPIGGKVAYAYLERGKNRSIQRGDYTISGPHRGDTIICGLDKANIVHTSTFGEVRGYAFPPLGDCLAALFEPSRGADYIIMLVNTTTNEIFRKIELASQSNGKMAFSANGELLAVSMYGVVGLWNIRSGQCVQKTRGESYHLEFSHDSKWLFSASSASIDVIEVGRQEMFSPDPMLRDNRPGKVLISPQGELVASWQEDVLKLWKLDSMAPMHELRAPQIGMLLIRVGSHVEFSPDSTKIFFRSLVSLKLWDISSEIEKRVFDITESEESVNDFSTGLSITIFSPNSRFLAASRILPQSPDTSSPSGGYRYIHIKVWDTVSGKLLIFLKSKPLIGIDLKFSPDSKRIAFSFDFDNNGVRMTRVELWDITSSSGTNSIVLSNKKLTDHLHKKIEELENGAYRSQSIYKPLSFLDDHNLAFRYRHYKDESEHSDVIIQIVLTTSPSITSRSEINDEALLTTEDSSFDIDSLHSWVTLDGERLIWLPPEYRDERSRHARFNCVATSNNSRPLSILKFCCSKCPKQAIAPGGPTKCTSNASAEVYTYKRRIDGEFIILRLDMDSPDNEMLELEAKKNGTLRKEWSRFKHRFSTSKD